MFLKCIMSGSAVLSAQMYCYRGIVLNDWSCIQQCHKIFTIVLSTSVTKITVFYIMCITEFPLPCRSLLEPFQCCLFALH